MSHSNESRGSAVPLLVAALAVALASKAGPASAEVSVDRPATGVVVPFFQPGWKGPWQQVRVGIPREDVLNALGDDQGDGWPVIFVNDATARPHCTWATGGDDAEIRLATHDTESWGTPLLVSGRVGTDTSPSGDSDPAGSVFVAWQGTRPGGSLILLRAFVGTSLVPAPALELTPESRLGRHPSLVVHGDEGVFVDSEELEGDPLTPIRVVVDHGAYGELEPHVVDGGESPIDLARELVIVTHLDGSAVGADPVLTSASGHLWLTWIDSSDAVGWSERIDGEWTDPAYVLISPAGGVAEAREQVREIVLAD